MSMKDEVLIQLLDKELKALPAIAQKKIRINGSMFAAKAFADNFLSSKHL